ncbi:RNA pseudouridine synthase [Helicobacter sp. 12S02634-8]|uniref:RluA family pseudouridine synthase n=1 Tax=Helicobacter sp. 12S02634-8 TaxID=1476199 RepID=UPI000BA67F35|nr:RluA family pseudouridine synthase [Helicobacter sp. 12S02634-8]PAF46539.1 RNA pseudouridine synthase [Helicobacter sp. 12S02634-8]
MEKAYKLLSIQEHISNKKAKALIDEGRVSCNGKQITIARTELAKTSVLTIAHTPTPKIIFEDTQILAIDKPPFLESYQLAKMFAGWSLLHRLDKETSGVILLIKENSPFHIEAKQAFKKQNVYKEYLALTEGIIAEGCEIQKPILTLKGTHAKSKISPEGLYALTIIKPLSIIGKKTLLQAIIKTGRTHQIRVHLKSIGYPIIGDTLYGGAKAKRLMLHAHKISLLGYDFTSPLPNDFPAY